MASQSIISDQGSVFISNFWQHLMTLWQCKLKTLTAYHLQADGQTERPNQFIEAYLRAFCSYQQNNWVDYLPLAEFSYNSKSAST